MLALTFTILLGVLSRISVCDEYQEGDFALSGERWDDSDLFRFETASNMCKPDLLYANVDTAAGHHSPKIRYHTSQSQKDESGVSLHCSVQRLAPTHGQHDLPLTTDRTIYLRLGWSKFENNSILWKYSLPCVVR